jgi:hypothetical protein
MAKTKDALQTYYILDKHMTQAAGQRFRAGTKSIMLTESQARFFVESGAMSLQDPASATKEGAAVAAQATDAPAPALAKAAAAPATQKAR